MRTAIGLVLIFISSQSNAEWPLGSKNITTATTIHSTYFLTPLNAPVQVNIQIAYGNYHYGRCVPSGQYLFNDVVTIKTGDRLSLESNKIASVFGLGLSCLSINYVYHQQVIDTIVLVSNGIDYIASFPLLSDVTIQ